MSQAKSQVQVSIVASLGKGFEAAFNSADKRMSALGKSAQDLSRKVGDVQGFRRQQNAVKEAGRAWLDAKAKAAALRQEIAATANPTRAQTAALARAEAQTRRTAGAYTEARTRLGDMTRELQKSGVNVAKLSQEYRRLQTELTRTNSKHEAAERHLQRQQALVRGMSAAWGKIREHAAGAAAAGAVVGMAGRKALPYDEQLARLADTATAGGGNFGATKTQLSAAVQQALKSAGGGSRDEVLAGLNTLIATGNMSAQEATGMLPLVAKGIFGGGAGGNDIAGIMLKLKGMGVSPQRGLEIAHRGGQVGGVELRDQARYLPEQIGQGMAAGYGGEAGLAAIVAMNQVALRTAGTPDQAANNVTNLLQKLSSQELSKNVKKETGVDFDTYALKNREKGIFKAESFAMLADKQMQSDPAYRALRKRAEAAKGKEQGAIINSMSAMMEGSGMGSLIQDRQALGAALAMMFARSDKSENGLGAMTSKITASGGALDMSVGRLSGETFAKTQMAGEAINAANENAYNALSGPIGALMQGFTNVTEAFPKLTAATYGAVTALSAIAAYGIVGGAVGKITGSSGAGAAGAGAGAAAGAATRAGLLGKVARVGGPMAAVGGLANFTTSGEDGVIDASIAREKSQYAALQGRYGQGTIDAAYKSKAPWYHFGGASAARPSDLEGWVKSYMAEKDAAAKAAQAASEAAKAAQSRPNITMHNSTSVVVNASDSGEQLGAQIEASIRKIDRQREADLRSSMYGRPEF